MSKPPKQLRAVGVANSDLRRYLLECGVAPTAIPDAPFRMLRPRQAWETLGVGKTKFYELAKKGAFRLVPLDRQPLEENKAA